VRPNPYFGVVSLADGFALGPVVAFGAAAGDPFGLPRSGPLIPVVVEFPVAGPRSIVPLAMPGLFMLSPCEAGPVELWANAEPHIRVTAVQVRMIVRIGYSVG